MDWFNLAIIVISLTSVAVSLASVYWTRRLRKARATTFDCEPGSGVVPSTSAAFNARLNYVVSVDSTAAIQGMRRIAVQANDPVAMLDAFRARHGGPKGVPTFAWAGPWRRSSWGLGPERFWVRPVLGVGGSTDWWGPEIPA